MTLKDVKKDPANLSMVVTAEFNAPVQRVWQLWADPRQLERWWGPPTYPATVVDHDLVPGGTVNYFMTGAGRRQKPRVLARPCGRRTAFAGSAGRLRRRHRCSQPRPANDHHARGPLRAGRRHTGGHHLDLPHPG